MTRPMLLFSCVFTLSQMFPTIFKHREMCNFNNVMVHFIWSPDNGVILPLAKSIHARDDDNLVRMFQRCGCSPQRRLLKTSKCIQDNTSMLWLPARNSDIN